MSLVLGVTGIAALVVAAAPGVAAAAPTGSGGNYTCRGTLASPGTLAGNFANVTIAGTCLVDAGNVNISGNLTVADGASLVADFGMNDQTDSGTSNLTVRGNVVVDIGGSALLGCYPLQVTLWGEGNTGPSLFTTPDFPCDDDPNAFPASGNSAPTLSATEHIGGNLIAEDALGVVVHNTTVGGNVESYGGGDGTAFNPVGIFAVYIAGGPQAGPGQLDEPIALPAYFDFANVTAGGNMVVTGMNENWYGIDRNVVHGNLTDTNNTAAPDGNETFSNTVYGNLACSGNNPAVEYGDSDGGPNKVGGSATGECGFNVLIPNPSPASVSGLTNYPLEHISLHLH
ncbi:MAG: hypothetical protein ACRDPY_24280 [Streptosporangiaceae bacterium]